MKCCDNNCNQGRDCPARVAPVKRSYSDNEYCTSWRRNIRELAKWLLISLIVMLLALFTVIGFACVEQGSITEQIKANG